MRPPVDWKKVIVIGHLVREKLAQVDVDEIWPFHLPELAATEDEVRSVERAIGFPLDTELRDFLLHANGWKAFYQSVDLFSTVDLVSGARHLKAQALLESLEPLEGLCGVTRAELFPVAVSQDDIDVFCLVVSGARGSGEVLWFAGQLIDRFPSFSEFVLAMFDYNRLAIADLSQR